MPIRIGQRPDHGFDEPIGLLSDCHRRIEHFLQVLLAVTEKVDGGPLSAAHRSDLEGALVYFGTAAPRHTADEEESLFPRLRTSRDPAARDALGALLRLERDHVKAGAHHAAVDRLIRQWLMNGWLIARDVRQLREHLDALQAIYREHIAFEDRNLFPAAARLLSGDQLHEIGREMAARRSADTKVSTRDRRSD